MFTFYGVLCLLLSLSLSLFIRSLELLVYPLRVLCLVSPRVDDDDSGKKERETQNEDRMKIERRE
jgi:hypothetical protein